MNYREPSYPADYVCPEKHANKPYDLGRWRQLPLFSYPPRFRNDTRLRFYLDGLRKRPARRRPVA